MQLWSAPQNYGVIPRLLHWLTVDLVILAWVLGTFGDELSRGSARSAGLFLHISAGLAVLALLVFRLVWRVIDRPPPPETTRFGNWLECLGKLTHVMLYALLAATPVVGGALQFARGTRCPYSVSSKSPLLGQGTGYSPSRSGSCTRPYPTFW